MTAVLSNLADVAKLIGWSTLWALGGIWIVRGAFNLRPNEQALAGFGVGLVLENWLANLLGHFMPVPLCFWLAGGIIFSIGLSFYLPFKRDNLRELLRIPIRPAQWIVLFLLAYVFFAVGSGLAVLDDYQNLPTVSLLATGNIPPRFPLDPNVTFNYHYFTLLLAAQVMRVAGLHVWNSLDLVRGLSLALTLMLSAIWIQRVTRSTLAGFVVGLVALFSSGSRWLMLLLPQGVLKQISPNIHMLGSAAQSAPDFLSALTGPWAVETGASWPFPFAYANGIGAPGIWTFMSGASVLSGAITIFLLLSHNRWRGWRAGAVTAALLAAIALVSETFLISMAVGLAGIAVLYAVVHKTLHLPGSLLRWAAVLAPAFLLALVQGGVLSGIFGNAVSSADETAVGANSYFTFGFKLFWPPAILSNHLGFLAFTNPSQLLTAVLEIGPMILLLPLPFFWAVKAFRASRWYETFGFIMPVLSLATLVVQYTGNAGPTALTRVQAQFIGLASGNIALASLWLWASHRKEWLKAVVGAILFLACFGGMVMFGIELLAAPKPIYSTFITILDAQAEKDYWNKLEPNAVIFDPTPSRAPTVFGRPTDSSLTWYEQKPAWSALVDKPNPAALRAAGFSYAYLDFKYWDRLPVETQAKYQNSCAQLVKEYVWDRSPYDFRRLYDLKGCPATQ